MQILLDSFFSSLLPEISFHEEVNKNLFLMPSAQVLYSISSADEEYTEEQQKKDGEILGNFVNCLYYDKTPIKLQCALLVDAIPFETTFYEKNGVYIKYVTGQGTDDLAPKRAISIACYEYGKAKEAFRKLCGLSSESNINKQPPKGAKNGARA